MAIIELNFHEVEITFAPKTVIFGSADETVGGSDEDTGRESSGIGSGPDVDIESNIPGIVLFGLGIALAIWLGRRRIANRSES